MIVLNVWTGDGRGVLDHRAIESAANVFMSFLPNNNRPTSDEDRAAASSIVTAYLEAVMWWATRQDSKAVDTCRWIASQQHLFFAECTQAEEIVRRCKEALDA